MNEPHMDPRPAPGMHVAPSRPLSGMQPHASVMPTIVKAPPLPKPVLPVHEEPLSLVEDHHPEVGAAPQSKIHAITGSNIKQFSQDWKRQAHVTSTGAIRVKSFHGRLSEQGLDYMDHMINEWLDRHAEVEVKNVTSSVGMFDGKMKEPAVILNLWY